MRLTNTSVTLAMFLVLYGAVMGSPLTASAGVQCVGGVVCPAGQVPYQTYGGYTCGPPGAVYSSGFLAGQPAIVVEEGTDGCPVPVGGSRPGEAISGYNTEPPEGLGAQSESAVNAFSQGQQTNTPTMLSPSCLKAFPQLGTQGVAAASTNNFTEAQCKAYLYLKTLYTPGSCGTNYDEQDGITKLNPTFALDLANMLRAAPYKITITSAYRSPQAEQCVSGRDVHGSLHTQGFAADLEYPDALGTSARGCDVGRASPSYQWTRVNASTFGINLYNQNGHSSYLPGECNHVELTNRNGIQTGRSYRIIAPPNPGDIAVNPGQGVNCERSGSAIDCSRTPTYGATGSGFGGLFGGNSGMGSMMMVMMGMQLGQSLGGAFGSLLANHSNTSNQSVSQQSYTPASQSAPIALPAPTGMTPIDQLLASLGSTSSTDTAAPTSATTSTSSVSAQTDTVGFLEATSTLLSGTFVDPVSGVIPLSVDAHFESGTPCSDAYDLSWGDGSADDTMVYQPPQDGSACSMNAKVNDITHTYTAPGLYLVTLLQGANLTAVSTTTVIAVATSSDLTGTLGTIAVNLDNASSALSEASSSISVSALSSAFGFLTNVFNAALQFFSDLFAGGSTANPTVSVEDTTIGTGTAASEGNWVSILYTAYAGSVSSSTVFDSSDFYGDVPYTFDLGTTTVISGLQIGIDGMRVGGERLITIPPSLAFGSQALTDASGTVIVPANSTVIFDVRLVDVATSTP